ncbi:hypothetical protein [Vibrio kanaloae]|uniref:Uncharacterized protein n=1 Tax=Vibrio kanaloae TaxID=170673 RepID=A0A4U1YSI2_9VIBR|nr:hypothetical protein [Vibrio kanaloae]TKF22867.1 hypothetical protein FCV52_19080 [Vibrio kanaloae]
MNSEHTFKLHSLSDISFYIQIVKSHWHKDGNGTCLTYSVETPSPISIELEACILGSSNLPETTTVRKDETTVLETPTKRKKPMDNSLKAKMLRWVKATVIAVSMGLSGSPSLQPNAL